MQSKYDELKQQCEMELEWTINSIRENHEGLYIPDGLTLIDFIGKDWNLTEYERGMLFAYLSIKSKIDYMEGN